MKRILWSMALVLAAALPAVTRAEADAQTFTLPSGVRGATHFELTAHGTLVVEPDGSVSEVELDMPASTREIYREGLARWRFNPVKIDGRVVRAKAHFVLDAKGIAVAGSNDVRFEVENVWFIDPPSAREPPRQAPFEMRRTPVYPSDAAREGYGAALHAMLKLDAEGRVIDVGITRLALTASSIHQRGRAERFAEKFANATIRAAEGWRITDAEAIRRGSAIIPVTYTPPQIGVDGWQPRVNVEVSLLPWMLVAAPEAVALQPSGEGSSSRFTLVDEVAGMSVN